MKKNNLYAAVERLKTIVKDTSFQDLNTRTITENQVEELEEIIDYLQTLGGFLKNIPTEMHQMKSWNNRCNENAMLVDKSAFTTPREEQPPMKYKVIFEVETDGYENVVKDMVWNNPLIQDGTYELISSKQEPTVLEEKTLQNG